MHLTKNNADEENHNGATITMLGTMIMARTVIVDSEIW